MDLARRNTEARLNRPQCCDQNRDRKRNGVSGFRLANTFSAW